MERPEFVLLVQWERTLDDLLDRTRRFDKAIRFTFSTRIDNLALDIMDHLVRARWARRDRQAALLEQADAHLEVLRVMVRTCCRRRHLDRTGLDVISRNLDEAGRMLGGWRKAVGSAP